MPYKKRRMNRRRSNRAFRNGARRIHPRNKYIAYNMRGGIRL